MNLIIVLFTFLFPLIPAAEGYDIKVELKNAESDTLYLGYYYANVQYLKDTAIRKNGVYRFTGDQALEPGIYLLVLPPKNEFVQLFINKNEQHLDIYVEAGKVVSTFKIKDSKDNELFYDYLNFLEIKRPQATALGEQIKTASELQKPALQAQLEAINKEVNEKQQNILIHYPSSISAILIKSTLEVDMPKYEGTPQEVELKRYVYYKAHYFDHMDLGDPRLLRSPLLHERIDFYLEKLTYQQPDSINQSLDYIFQKLKPAEETFKFYLIHFLNKYAGSKVVGFDGIYVHLVDEYYNKGFAPWVESEQLEKIQKNANSLRPILIGKTAPEIKVLRYPTQTSISLHSIKSPYTVLFIWDPSCSHCKSSLPHIVKFYEKFKSKGVEILAVCSQFGDKIPECWKYLEEQKINPGWINAADPNHASRYKILYDVKTTPQIFILDVNKKILSKSISGEQLDEVMTHILQANL